ncbi:serine/threonine-protein kinase, partial [Pelomonas sp. KK5]|uniref:serine/threonine protein kinase n=1 Tax=Pelomonas sp. KK5 TaxID=1855730 RepID=UPI00117EA526
MDSQQQRSAEMMDDDPDRTVVNATLPTRIVPVRRPPPLPKEADTGPDTEILPTATPAFLHREEPVQAPPPARRPSLPKGAESLALPPGFRLHEYRIDSVLGKGGFGITYLATDVNLNTRVAIKEYLPEEIAFRKSGQTVSAHSTRHQDRYRNGLDSFLVEGRTLASFRHPNIVRVARFFEAHQTAYMVLDFERGSPLKAWWPKHAEMPEKELVLLLQPLLDGLSVVHAAGFLHRDIKPDNIQVRRSDGSLVLLDFGSARAAVGSGAASDDVAVTPGYAPIEQYQDGDQGAWTDIYAMGATLYWMLTGKKPPDAMDRSANDTLRPVREGAQAGGRWSDTLLDAIDWALKLEPAERPQTVDAWREKLFAAHAASLSVQDALRSGEGAAERRQWINNWRRLVSPGSWPLALKLSLAGMAAALLPMLSTGWYNLKASQDVVTAGELRNL